MDAYVLFTIAALFFIVFITLFLLFNSIKSDDKKLPNSYKAISKSKDELTRMQTLLSEISRSRDTYREQVKSLMERVDKSPSDSRSSSCVSTQTKLEKLKKDYEDVKMSRDQARAKIIEMEKSLGGGDKSKKTEIAGLLNDLGSNLKNIWCQSVYTEFDKEKRNFINTVKNNPPLSCAEGKSMIETNLFGKEEMTNVLRMVSGNRDISGVLSTFNKIIDAVMRKACVNDVLDPNKLEQALQEISNHNCATGTTYNSRVKNTQ